MSEEITAKAFSQGDYVTWPGGSGETQFGCIDSENGDGTFQVQPAVYDDGSEMYVQTGHPVAVNGDHLSEWPGGEDLFDDGDGDDDSAKSEGGDPVSTEPVLEVVAETPKKKRKPAVKTTRSPDDFAFTPDTKHPSTWKLDISDPAHISMAITSLQPGGFEGKKVQLPDGALSGVISKIRAKVNAMPDGDDKDRLIQRLDALTPRDDSKDATKAVETEAIEEFDSVFEPDIDTSLKFIKTADGTVRVGGYLVRFGSVDLANERFSSDTNFMLDAYDKRPVFFHHGQDKDVKATMIGTIDYLEKDTEGIWAEAVLNMRNKYVSQVKQMVEDQQLGWSSGALSYMVQKKKRGQVTDITQWPIVEGSLTPTPAEPMGTGAAVIKSLNFFAPAKAGLGHIANARTTADAFKSLNINPDWEDAIIEEKPEVVSHKSVKPNTVKDEEEMPVDFNSPEFMAAVEAATKSAFEKRELEAQAAKAQDAAFEAEVQKRLEAAKAALPVAAPVAEVVKGAGLPLQALDNAKSNAQVSVLGDRKYDGMSSSDMAYLSAVKTAIAMGTRQGELVGRLTPSERNPTMRDALNFYNTMTNDQNRTFERELAAKAFKEIATSKRPDSVKSIIPFRNANDVEANAYDLSVIKALRRQEMEISSDGTKNYKSQELDNTAQTSFGTEWIPTIWGDDVWLRVRISNPVASLIDSIQMPSNPYKVPIESVDPTVYYIGEATDLAQLVFNAGNTFPISKIGSAIATITAKKLGIRVGWSNEMVEDEILFPLIARYRAQSMRVLQNYVDDTIINGDVVTTASTNVNLIDGTPAAGTSYLAFDGMRKYGLVTNSTTQALNFAGTPTLGLFRQLRGKLAKQYAVDLVNLVYVVDFGTYMKMLGMPEFTTFMNVGAAATNLTGLLPGGNPNTVDPTTPYIVGMIDGIPVYVSAQIGTSNTAGMISGTPSNNLYGTAILFHKTRWMLGYRRNIQMDTLTLTPLSDTTQLIATVRYGLVSFDTQSAAVGYNISI